MNSKSLRNVSDDCKMMNLLKQIPHLMTKHITHLYNVIISSNILLDSIKVARILPLRIGAKVALNKDSSRPIIIMNRIEKVVENIFQIEYYHSPRSP